MRDSIKTMPVKRRKGFKISVIYNDYILKLNGRYYNGSDLYLDIQKS